MKGLYIKYDSYGKIYTYRISSFCFEGENWIDAHEKDAGEGRIYSLKCKCGSNDWVDNGRHLNEVECNGCGQFLSISPLELALESESKEEKSKVTFFK